MPPKSKAKTNKKDEGKILAKSDQNPSATDKTMADKGWKKIKEDIAVKRQKVQDKRMADKGWKKIKQEIGVSKEKMQHQIESHSSVPEQFKVGKMAEKITDLKDEDLVPEDSAPKKLLESREDPLKQMLEMLSLEGSSLEPELSDEEAFYNENLQKSFVADAEKLLAGTFLTLQPEEAAEAEESAESAEAEEAAEAAEAEQAALKEAYAVEGESSDEDMPEYLKQAPLVQEADFFGKMGDVPDVEQLSMDESVEIIKVKEKTKPKPKPAGQGDVGKFVDPITGKIIYTQDSEEEIIVVVKKPKRVLDEPMMIDGRVVKEIKMLPPVSDDEVSIDILSDQEQEDEALATTTAADDTFNQFLTLEATGPVIDFQEIDIDAFMREENARILREQTYEFVQYLIDMAVEQAEYVDPTVILRQNLDKRKLLKELNHKYQLLEVERRGKQFLNRKCVEYYRRKRNVRPLLEDNPKTLHIEYRKYQAALISLDNSLIKEDEAKTISKKSLEVARAQIIAENARSQEKVQELEELISKTLKRENFDKLQQVVTRTINQMHLKRKEISDTRFQMIQKQHNWSILTERLRKMEDLGNGLSMRDFTNLHTDTQGLGKKIEDRNSELNKLRVRSQGDIHRMTHLKEKQSMLRASIIQQREYMGQLEMKKQSLRECLHRFKIQRNRLRKEIRERSFQSGLLDKPVLLKDYDTTMVYVADLRNRIVDSQVTIKTIKEKIKHLEQHYNNQ